MMQILEKKEVKEINALRTGSRTVPITDLHLEHSFLSNRITNIPYHQLSSVRLY